MANLESKPWRRPGSVLSDWFNYGFDELSWEAYCYRRRDIGELAATQKANVIAFAGLQEEQLLALPPEARTMVMAGTNAMMNVAAATAGGAGGGAGGGVQPPTGPASTVGQAAPVPGGMIPPGVGMNPMGGMNPMMGDMGQMGPGGPMGMGPMGMGMNGEMGGVGMPPGMAGPGMGGMMADGGDGQGNINMQGQGLARPQSGTPETMVGQLPIYDGMAPGMGGSLSHDSAQVR